MVAALQTGRRQKNSTRRNKEVSGVPRPKLPITKEARIDVRMHPAVRAALEHQARTEGRTMSQLCERVLRQFVLREMLARGESTADIDALP
jgi:hypothetical protein